MSDTGAVLVLAAAASVVAAVLLMISRRPSTSITLTEPAEPGEILNVGSGRSARSWVVREVLTDLTLSHVVLVVPWRRWHRWAWARRWLLANARATQREQFRLGLGTSEPGDSSVHELP